MEQKVNTLVSKFATPSMLIALASAIIWLIVEVKKVPVIDQRQTKWIDRQTEMHAEFDQFKEEAIERIHQVEISVKDEKIERLQAEIEYLKK